MLTKYLFLVLLVNIPLTIGFYMYSPPKEQPRDQPCGCNGNSPNLPVPYNPHGQLNVMYIPVPVPVPGMYPPYIGGPALMSPIDGPGYPPNAGHPPYPHFHRGPCSQARHPVPTSTELPATNQESDE